MAGFVRGGVRQFVAGALTIFLVVEWLVLVSVLAVLAAEEASFVHGDGRRFGSWH